MKAVKDFKMHSMCIGMRRMCNATMETDRMCHGIMRESNKIV